MFGERFVDIGPDQEWTSKKPDPELESEPKPAGRSRREFLGGLLAAGFTTATIGCKEEKPNNSDKIPPTIPENLSEPVLERSNEKQTYTETAEPEPPTPRWKGIK